MLSNARYYTINFEKKQYLFQKKFQEKNNPAKYPKPLDESPFFLYNEEK